MNKKNPLDVGPKPWNLHKSSKMKKIQLQQQTLGEGGGGKSLYLDDRDDRYIF